MQVYIARRRCRCCELISSRLIPVDRSDIGVSSTIYRSGGIFREGIREKRPNPVAPRSAAFGSRYIVQYVYVLCLIKKHKSRTDFTRIFLGGFLYRHACRTRSIIVQRIREKNPHKLLPSVCDTIRVSERILAFYKDELDTLFTVCRAPQCEIIKHRRKYGEHTHNKMFDQMFEMKKNAYRSSFFV